MLHADRAVVRGYLSTETQPRETMVNALNVYRSGRASPSERMLATIQAKVDVLRAWASHAPS